MPVFSIGDKTPNISDTVYCAPTATITADVTLKENVTVWPGASIRGDEAAITVGKNSNIQDNAVLHTDPHMPMIIGENVTVAHGAILHSCNIGDNSLIGMGAIVLNRAKIAPYTLVGAGTLVAENKEFPEGVLLLGSPARIVRKLTEQERANLKNNATHYVERGRQYQLEAKEFFTKVSQK